MLRNTLAVLTVVFLVGIVAMPQSVSPGSPQTALPAEVQVKLLLADKKATFRIGEPIKLVMEFTAEKPGYKVEVGSDLGQPIIDTIVITPDSEVVHWADEMSGGYRYMRDVIATDELTSAPKRVEVTLNDSLRFDRPGRYNVKITTRRLYAPKVPVTNPEQFGQPGTVARARALEAVQTVILPITTNEVSFDLVAMSEDEEQKEVKRITGLIDAKPNSRIEPTATNELAYLTGDVSAREKVRRCLNPQGRPEQYWTGLFIVRNRDLVLQLLEAALRDPNQPVDSSLVAVVSRLRVIKEGGGAPAETKVVSVIAAEPETVNSRFNEVQNNYLAELAIGLTKRQGKSLTRSAMTILTMSDKNDKNRETLVREACRAVVQQFGSLNRFEQDYLLRGYSQDLIDPSLIGPLKAILADTSRLAAGVHAGALKKLIELAPDEARPFVIASVCAPMTVVDRESFGRLSIKALPEVDTCLLEQLKRLASSDQVGVGFFLGQKSALVALFATENIYQDVMRIFRDNKDKIQVDTRAAMLAYFAKYNEAEAIPLIEQTLAEVSRERDFNFLPSLTKLYYSPAIGELVKKRLETDQPQVASNAAYLLGLHGEAADELILRARLQHWRKDWSERVAEADANRQGLVERELIYALLHGKAWKVTPEQANELKTSCVTKMCKDNNRY
jgi:hypothetical protein